MRRIARSGLLAGCALSALLVAAPNASAQSFQGIPNAVVGSPSISTDPGGGGALPSTTISMGDAETVINWTVNTIGSGSVVFQPANTSAFFVGDDIGDFTVLNRVIPIDAATGSLSQNSIEINGNITGFVNPPGNQPGIGGQVWFYSPTGIIVGSTAQIAVGSLLLTTHDIGFQPDPPAGGPPGPPGFILGPGGTVSFNSATDPNSFVQIQPGAQISAFGNPQGGVAAYVALVSPRIEQGGTVNADGSVSYLAADQLDMTINAGLVDFELTVGTNDGNGIVHTGTTTGPSSTSAADRQVIAMVALPRNDALTMLLSGTIGYSAAATAAQEGSSVVLSSGFTNEAPTQAPAGTVGSIEITASTFLNDVTGFAADNITVSPNPGLIDFQGNVSLNAAQSIDFTAEIREEIRVAGNLNLNAGLDDGGDIDIVAFTTDGLGGGIINVTGGMTVNSSTSAGFFSPSPALNTEGGFISLLADGGIINAANIYGYAEGYGTFGFGSDPGGDGRGGFINALVTGGGTISAGTLSLSSSGYGGGSESGIAGNGFGGTTSLNISDGIVDASVVSLEARASGGFTDSGTAGNADGGLAWLQVYSGDQFWDELYINGTGSAGFSSGSFAGGVSGSVVDGGEGSVYLFGPTSLNISGQANIQADAISTVGGAPGIVNQAGLVTIDVLGGASFNIDGDLLASASAYFNSDTTSGGLDNAPTQRGGEVRISASGGSLQAGNANINAYAEGLAGPTSAGALGGNITVSALDGGSIVIDNGSTESFLGIDANGYGASGAFPTNSTGGTARIVVEDGSVSVNGNLAISADGRSRELFDPPADGDGFNGNGGTSSIELLAGTLGSASLTAGSIKISAAGDSRILQDGSTLPGGEPVAGNGGAGTGGNAFFVQSAGTVLASDILLDANGLGGASASTADASAFASGNGVGGTALFDAIGGSSSFTSIQIQAGGIGGGGAPDASSGWIAALAGNGTGGTATFSLTDASVTAGPLQINASAVGGAGMGHAANGNASAGGTATGGNALFTINEGSGSVSVPSVLLAGAGVAGAGGNSVGGNGGAGGMATGGLASADITDGQFSIGIFGASADGTGGSGGTGGNANGSGGGGVGGTTQFAIADANGPAGPRSIINMGLFASGNAGSGAGPVPATTAGTVNLLVDAFDATSGLAINGFLSVLARGTTAPAGAGVTATITNAPLLIGGNFEIETSRDIVITANSPITVNGPFAATGRSFSETGLLQAGAIGIIAPQSIDAERLTSGDVTLLLAANGPISIDDLNSIGQVTAQAQSIDITSTGALNFDVAQATAGPLSITTAGNLLIQTGASAGAMTLSSNGVLSSSTQLLSAGNFSASGAQGVNLASVNSFGTSQLSSSLGDVTVASFSSVGTASVSGINVNITGNGPLTFSIAQAASNLAISSPGNLAFASVDAGGTINLLSSGTISASGDVLGGPTTLVATDDIDIGGVLSAAGPLLVTTPGAFSVAGDTSASSVSAAADSGISLAGLASAGTTSLIASGGPVSVTDLTSTGPVTVRGTSVNLASSGALSFADLDATAGSLSVQTAGNLQVATVDATGAVTLRSTAGSFNASGAINSGGALVIAGQTGLVAGTASSGGTTSLQASNGAISITSLTSAGAVTATGRSIALASPGALNVASASATAGPLTMQTAGNLTLSNGSSTGLATLRSTNGSIVSVGTISAGNGAIVDGRTGVNLGALSSGGTTQLTSAAGNVAVRTLSSTGPVSATGTNVDIGGSGSLTFTTAQAVDTLSIVTDGDLQFGAVTAGGDLELASSLGSLSASGDVTGGATALLAGQDIALALDLLASGPLEIDAGGGVSVLGAAFADEVGVTSGGDVHFASLNSGGATGLSSATGSIDVDDLVSSGSVSASAGSGIEIDGTGPLTFSTLAAGGSLYVNTTGALTLPTTSAGGNVDLTSQGGALIINGDLTGGNTSLVSGADMLVAGDLSTASFFASSSGTFEVQGLAEVANAQVSGFEGILLPSLVSDGHVSLSASSGSILVSELLAAGQVDASAQDVDITSSGGLEFGFVDASNGNVRISTAGDLLAFGIFASGTATLDSGGTFGLIGGLVGTDIMVSSADIAIDGGEGFIGQHGVTDTVTLLNRDPSRTTFIGGSQQGNAYSLDMNEARVLFADNSIRLGVAPSDLPDGQGLVQVGNLAMTFEPEGNVGSGGTIEISTPTELVVNGQVQITTVDASDTLLIDPVFVAIDTTTGSIRLASANGAPTGTLAIIGDTVAVGTTDVINQLRTPPGIEDINALLDVPGGTGEPLTAGTISVTVADGFFVQNSGATTEFEDRRGFNAGNLQIETGGPDTQIAINGVIQGANGPVTGLDTTPLVTINGIPAAAGGQFDPGSTINGCVIGSNCAFVPEPQRPPAPPTSDDLVPVDPGDTDGSLIAPLIELADTNPLIEPPLVDEPITGVGNDDLWEPPCEAVDEDGICRGGNEQQ